MSQQTAVGVGGPHFEDLERGQVFEAPAMTVDSGHAAIHQAIAGDRLALPLDATLSREVTGAESPLVHPNLVCDVAIGQSTVPTQRVLGNLFYRGLVLLRPVFAGDTLRTRTEVVALKQNRPRSEGPATGLAALRIQTENQRGEPVLDFYRCPMLPLRDPAVATGHEDGFESISSELEMDRVRAAVPDWRYGALRERVPPEVADPSPGAVFAIEGRDTVTSAPELARLTLNLAMTHRDPAAGAHGRRLVYGGPDDLDRRRGGLDRASGAGDDRRLAQLRSLGAGLRGRRPERRAGALRVDAARRRRAPPSPTFAP